MGKRRADPEGDIQRETVARLRACGVWVFHVPNGSKAPPQYRAHLARLGLSKGVPDLIIVTPPPAVPGCVGAALELKAPGGRVSDAQADWLERLHRAGWATSTAYGLAESLHVLRAWGYPVGRPGDPMPLPASALDTGET